MMKKIIFSLIMSFLALFSVTNKLLTETATAQNISTKATVKPFLTLTITGVANGSNITSKNSSCLRGDVTNPGSGNDATSTHVNLGSLKNGVINISAQQLSISTNVESGYSLTTTSSGKLTDTNTKSSIADVNKGNGLTANDTPAPKSFPALGNEAFGIHPCGQDVNSTLWANSATGFESGAKYINPWNNASNNYYSSIASYSSPSARRKTIVEYGATIGPNTPVGTYSANFTFVVTVNF